MVALGLLVAALTVNARSIGLVKKGDKAPAVSAMGTDGKTHTLASLTKTGSVYFYFIKEGCPVNHRAAPFVTKMTGEYGEKANLVGIYNGSVADAKKWASRYGAKYPILADPDLKLIRSYGVPYSPFVVGVGKDGKVVEVLEGLSDKELGKLNGGLATNCSTKAIAMDYKGAPSGGG